VNPAEAMEGLNQRTEEEIAAFFHILGVKGVRGSCTKCAVTEAIKIAVGPGWSVRTTVSMMTAVRRGGLSYEDWHETIQEDGVREFRHKFDRNYYPSLTIGDVAGNF
jgi:hypothetical protein